MRTGVARGALGAGVVFLAACAAAVPSGLGQETRYIAGVPFFPQEDYYCGPAALASVLTYWGKPVSQEEVARAIYLPHLKGTLTLDLLLYAARSGVESRMERGDLSLLYTQVHQGSPVIALLNLGSDLFPVWHYLVVVGFRESVGEIITYSGREKDKIYPAERFERMWAKSGFWTLLVRPRAEGYP